MVKIRYNVTVRHKKGVFLPDQVFGRRNMQDRGKTGNRIYFFIIMFFLAVLVSLLSLSGCGSRDDRNEEGLEEIALDEKETAHGEQGGAEADPDGETGNGSDRNSAGYGTEPEKEETVFVYICGAVNTPGVYELDKDARVFEAIRSAGGMTDEAAPDAINQARVVSDGEQIYVPTAEEAESQGTGGEGTVTESAVDDKVNINTAGKDELMTLTGIGEAKAGSILRYREENGRFESIEELMEIEGIKEGVFNKIKDDITI